MITTLENLLTKGVKYDPILELWVDEQGNLYRLKDKDVADMIEVELVGGTDYEHYMALHSLTNDGHGS